MKTLMELLRELAESLAETSTPKPIKPTGMPAKTAGTTTPTAVRPIDVNQRIKPNV